MTRASLRRCSCRVPRTAAGARLDGVAAEWLRAALGRPLSRSAIRRLVLAGAIRVNGQAIRRPGHRLAESDRLDAAVDERRLAATGDADSPPPPIPVLFEDEALVAVAKPPFLAMHATADASRPDLYSLVLDRFRDRTASPYLGLHHRLDRDTSGIVLFTKVPEANASLAAQFADRQVRKVYHALAERRPGPCSRSWRASGLLAQVGSGRQSRVESVHEGGQPAETDFVALETFTDAVLVEARPHTGRKHQIRAHLREHGTPIFGDSRYGGRTRIAGTEIRRPMLHARSLALHHPLTGAALALECEYPEDFESLLQRLRLLDTATRSR